MIVTIPELRNMVPVRSKSPIRAIIFMASLMLLSACDQQNESGRVSVEGPQTNMSFTPPTQLLASRSIVRANLVLEITIGDKKSIVEPNANGVYEFKTTRPANSSTTVTLLWSELIDGELLPLARASKILTVGASPTEPLRFLSSEFDFASFDIDEDGTDNYTERRDGSETAFNDPDSPASPPVSVTIDVRLSLPVGMRNATAERRAAVSAQAVVNSEEILLSRDGDVWTGSATVTENSEPLVTVTFYAADNQRIRIATLARNQNIGGGGQATFKEDDYEVDTFNDDGDAFTNIQETAMGSNPRDSSDPRAPVADAGADQRIASGASVTLNGSGSSSTSGSTITTYRWSEGTRQAGTGASLVVSGLDAGAHVFTLLVTDSLGLTDTDTVTVTVAGVPVPNQEPVANAGADQTVSSGASVSLDGSGSSDTDGNIVTYRWSEGSDSLATVVKPVVSGLSDGLHTITLEVTDDDGDTDTDTVTVTVTATPVPTPDNVRPVADAGEDQTIDSGDAVKLDGSDSSDSDGEIVSYRWSEGGETLSTEEKPQIEDLSDGEHTITLLVTDDEGATSTDTVLITVTAAAPEPNRPPSADAGTDQTVDSGEPVTLDASGSVDEDGTIISYDWSEEDTDLSASGVSPDIADLSNGLHEITLLVEDDDGDTDIDTVMIDVIPAPALNLPPMADAGEDQIIASGGSVILDGSGSVDEDGTIISYDWSEEGTDLSASGESPEITDLSDGSHVISLLVEDNDGDTGIDTVMIDVTPALESNLPPMADAGEDQIIASGETVLLDGSASVDEDGLIASYDWFKGDELLVSGISVEIDGLTDGSHLIDLVVTDDKGATGTDAVSVSVTAVKESAGNEATDSDTTRVYGAKTSAVRVLVVPLQAASMQTLA